MRLYAGFAPNALRVTIFLSEKGLEIPVAPINVPNGDTKTEVFLALNSLGEIPVLALDDGTVLTESVAICRYLEALHPQHERRPGVREGGDPPSRGVLRRVRGDVRPGSRRPPGAGRLRMARRPGPAAASAGAGRSPGPARARRRPARPPTAVPA